MSDERGVKKAAGNQLLHDCSVAEGESSGKENRIGQNAVDRARLAIQQEMQELKKRGLTAQPNTVAAV